MKIPEEMIDQLAGEVLKELEEETKAAGRKVSFDDLEGSVLRIRQKIGQQLLQKSSDTLDTKTLEKKTARNVMKNSSTKDKKKKK